MTAYMLDLETGVAHRGQQQAAGILFQRRVLVDQFVRDGDADSAHHRAHRQHPAELTDPAPAFVADENPAAPEQHCQQQRYCGQAQQAVVALRFQRRHFVAFIRVGRVTADDEIQQGNDAEHHRDHQPGPGVGMGAVQRPVIAQWNAQYRDQPDPVADLFQGEHPV